MKMKSKLYIAICCLLICLVARNSAQDGSGVISSGECGIPTVSSGNSRVVGGRDATPGQWPWQAMIETRGRFSSYRFVCGGTLVRPKWVITAAHCLESNIWGIKVLLGVNDVTNSGEETRQTHDANYVNHPDYVSQTFFADISLLELQTEATYNDWVLPACLPPAGSVVSAGETCIVSGFGDTLGTGNEDVLQYAEVDVISFESCTTWYGDDDVYVPNDHVCAGFETGGTDTCQGDSGGPLACPENVGETALYVLWGITSFGINCAEARRPGVYTKVETYLDWIYGYLNQTDTATPQTSSTTTTTTTTSTTLKTTSTSTNSATSLLSTGKGTLSVVATASASILLTTTSGSRVLNLERGFVVVLFSCMFLLLCY